MSTQAFSLEVNSPNSKYTGPCVDCGIINKEIIYCKRHCPRCYHLILRKNNPEQNRKSSREWLKRNPQPDKKCLGKITEEEYQALPDYCVYCFSVEKLEKDHIHPIDKEGWHTVENITSACKSCNSSKNNKLLSEWLADEAATIEFWHYPRFLEND